MYGADLKWWEVNQGVPEFAGIRVTQCATTCNIYDGIQRVELKPCKGGYVTKIMTDPPGVIGWGCNSGYQAANLAVQFGVKAILLAGFDMHLKNGVHFFGEHQRPLQNPSSNHLTAWGSILDRASKEFSELGVEVINLNKNSALRGYPKMTIEKAMQCLDL